MTTQINATTAPRSLSGDLGSNKNRREIANFRPLPLIAGGNAQTIAALFWPQRGEWFPAAHQLIDLPDGDKLAIVISTPPDWRPGLRTVVMVHGLCGCYQSAYMIRIAGKLYRRGVRTVRVNLRGCGSGIGLARYPYHSGRSEDVRRVLEWLGREDAPSPVTLVGFSLGGNIVLKLAGEDADRPTAGLDSVISVSAPIDLETCSQLIGHPRNRMYDSYFVRRLLQGAYERQRFFPDLPAPDFPRRMTLRIFDELYTAPRSGFGGASDYYMRASSAPLIDRIAVPALLVFSRDDPFIAAAPFEQLAPRQHIELRMTAHGGHLGFLGFTGRPLDFRWLDQQLIDWISRRSAVVA